MMMPLVLFFSDFLLSALFNQWLVYLLLVYVITKIFESEDFFALKKPFNAGFPLIT